jgi:hypothetical protein
MRLNSFTILHNLPQIYHLSKFGIPVEAPTRYDYYADTYGEKGRPKLGIAGGRPAANMKALDAIPLDVNNRKMTNYKENMFASNEVGIGFADDEEEKTKLEKKKKKMVHSL